MALPPPVIDDDGYTTYRTLRWDDFRARDRGGDDSVRRRERERTGRSVTAWLYSVIQIDEVDIVAEPLRDGRWRARIERYRVYALMDKQASGVVVADATPEILEHEQGHFDLAELCARRFRGEIADLEVIARSAERAQQRLVDELGQRHERLGRRFRLMQQRYDGETDHAQKTKAQRRWRRDLDRWLSQEMPDTCTG